MSALATAARVTVLLAAGAFAGALPVAAAPAVEPEETHQTEGRQDLALWKLANFVLLAGIAGYFIYKKGGAFFTARTAQIRRGLEEAAQARQDAEARYAEMERRLANLAVEIEGLREQAHQESSLRKRARAARDRAGIEENPGAGGAGHFHGRQSGAPESSRVLRRPGRGARGATDPAPAYARNRGHTRGGDGDPTRAAV